MTFPNSNKISDYTFTPSKDMVSMVYTNTDKALLKEVFEGAGMTGFKYRENFMDHLYLYLKNTYPDWATQTDLQKGNLGSLVGTAIAGILAFCTTRRTVVKNLQQAFKDRPTTDPWTYAYKFIVDYTVSYVKDKMTGTALFPSVKITSCMADFAMLGMMAVTAAVQDEDYLYPCYYRSFEDWPEEMRVQFYGNLELVKAAQDDHKAWCKILWEEEITSTANTSNTNFTAKFEEKFYRNTVKDNIQLLSPTLQRLLPAKGGYTKQQVVAYMIVCHKIYCREYKRREVLSEENRKAEDAASAFMGTGTVTGDSQGKVPINTWLATNGWDKATEDAIAAMKKEEEEAAAKEAAELAAAASAAATAGGASGGGLMSLFGF